MNKYKNNKIQIPFYHEEAGKKSGKLVKAIYDRPVANIILNGIKLK
jgi:hypothetical protein